MPSTDVLESAGRRAAMGPVPAPPSLDALAAEVDRRRNKKRRVIGGGLAALAAVVVIPLGVMAVDEGEPDVVTLGAEDEPEAVSDEPSSLAAPLAESSSTLPPLDAIDTPTSTLDRGPFTGLSDEDFDLQLDLAGMEFAIEVISGDDAAARAAEAEAAADETRDIDGQAVWIDERGEDIAASAYFDDDPSDGATIEDATFVQVIGPAEQIERVLDLVTEHANGPVQFFDLDGFAERFDLPEGVFDGEGAFDGEFPFGDDGPFGEGFPFEDGEFPFEQFFDEGALDEFRSGMQDFAECMDITVERNGDTTSIEIPNCDFPAVDGLFDAEAFGNLPFELDGLFENLPEDLDELFNGLEDELQGAS